VKAPRNKPLRLTFVICRNSRLRIEPKIVRMNASSLTDFRVNSLLPHVPSKYLRFRSGSAAQQSVSPLKSPLIALVNMAPSVMKIIDNVETERGVLSAIHPLGRGERFGVRMLKKQRGEAKCTDSTPLHTSKLGNDPPLPASSDGMPLWDILCTASRSRAVHFGLEGRDDEHCWRSSAEPRSELPCRS